MSKITLEFMQRFMDNLDTSIRDFIGDKIDGKQDAPIIMSKQMTMGQTSVTFTGLPTTGVVMTEVYTSKAGLDYDSIVDNGGGSITVNYEEQDSTITVYLKVEVYT